jgi:hypothetical protein
MFVNCVYILYIYVHMHYKNHRIIYADRPTLIVIFTVRSANQPTRTAEAIEKKFDTHVLRSYMKRIPMRWYNFYTSYT